MTASIQYRIRTSLGWRPAASPRLPPALDSDLSDAPLEPAEPDEAEDPRDAEIARLRHELIEAEKDIRMLRMLLKAKW